MLGALCVLYWTMPTKSIDLACIEVKNLLANLLSKINQSTLEKTMHFDNFETNNYDLLTIDFKSMLTN